jgi:GT2 family glycosyltransferase
MSATAIVPTWNGSARLKRLLASLDSGAAVIVVDNGSSDGTRAMVRTEFPDVDVISFPANRGFSKAVNRAAASASTDTIVLLNDDCVCTPGFVDELAAGIDRGRGVIMAAGVLTEETRPELIDSAGLELDDTLQVFDYLNGQHVGVLRSGIAHPVGPCGAAAAFDREAFLEIGGFDENLFAYWEDVDLVLRLRLSGGSCELVPSAVASHSHSRTLGSGSARKNYLTGFGRAYMVRKWSVLNRSRAIRVVAYESSVCLAQLVVDRTIAGAKGRIEGWQAGRGIDRRAFPVELLADGRRRTLVDEARRRSARRRRVGSAS